MDRVAPDRASLQRQHPTPPPPHALARTHRLKSVHQVHMQAVLGTRRGRDDTGRMVAWLVRARPVRRLQWTVIPPCSANRVTVRHARRPAAP